MWQQPSARPIGVVKATASGNQKFSELEGLRGVCASIVVLSHWGNFLPGSEGVIASLAAMLGPLALPSVIVFFVLSGFVIGHSTPSAATQHHLRNYLFKRFVRLYPIYILTLVSSFIIAGVPIFSQYFALHAAFLNNTFIPTIVSNGPLWSLNNEVCYYLIFAIIWIIPRSIYVFLFISIGGMCLATFQAEWYFNLIGLFFFWLLGLMLSKNSHILAKFIIDSSSPRFWTPLFLLGANMSTGALPALLNRLGAHSGQACEVAVNGILIVDIFLAVMGKNVARQFVPFYIISIFSTIAGLVYGLYAGKFGLIVSYWIGLVYFILAIVSWFLRFAAPRRSQWAAISLIGGISYALYLVHYPIFFATREILPGSWLAIFFAVPLSFAVAVFLEVYLQPRIRSVLLRTHEKRWLQPSRPVFFKGTS